MPNGEAETMKDQGTPQGQSAAPNQDGSGGGSIRERVVALETESKHAATKADLTEQVSKLREDTNRQFAELRKENAELRAEAVEREARILKQMAELQSSVEGQIPQHPEMGRRLPAEIAGPGRPHLALRASRSGRLARRRILGAHCSAPQRTAGKPQETSAAAQGIGRPSGIASSARFRNHPAPPGFRDGRHRAELGIGQNLPQGLGHPSAGRRPGPDAQGGSMRSPLAWRPGRPLRTGCGSAGRRGSRRPPHRPQASAAPGPRAEPSPSASPSSASRSSMARTSSTLLRSVPLS